jgi:hypothetical protein
MEDWNEYQIIKLKNWIDKQMALINSEIANRFDGEPTGIFDEKGNPGKMAHQEDRESIQDLTKERIETKLRQVGISCVVDLTVTFTSYNPRLPGHSNCRVSFCVGGPVPYMFR